jgi:predicted transcriptional regulator
LHASRFYQPSGTDRGKCKGWLEVEKEGNTNYYKPSVDRSQALEEEIH